MQNCDGMDVFRAIMEPEQRRSGNRIAIEIDPRAVPAFNRENSQ